MLRFVEENGENFHLLEKSQNLPKRKSLLCDYNNKTKNMNLKVKGMTK